MTAVLRNGLVERGLDVRVLAGSPIGGSGQADYSYWTPAARGNILTQASNPSAYRRLRQVLDAFRPDVVHVRGDPERLSPLILPPLSGIPAVRHVGALAPVCPVGTKVLPDGRACSSRSGAACRASGCLPLHRWVPFMVGSRLWRQWGGAFDRVVASSETIRKRLEDEGVAPVQVILNGTPALSSRPPLVEPPTVGFAGRLERQKGLHVLLSGFRSLLAHVPDARLIVAGDGPERVRLERLSASLRLGDRISFLGQIPWTEMPSQLAAAWVQVVPSTAEEGFGLVAAEAMMRGTAVIASDVGGLSGLVQEGHNGLLVPPSDPGALAAALRRVLEDRVEAERLGRHGREIALRQFTADRCVDEFCALYADLVRSSPARGGGRHCCVPEGGTLSRPA